MIQCLFNVNLSMIHWFFDCSIFFFVCICWPNYTVFVCLCQCFANLYFFFSMVLHSTVCCFSNNNGLECLRNFNKKKKKRRLWFIYLNICPFFRFVHSCILFDLSCWFFHVTKFFLAQLMIEKKIGFDWTNINSDDFYYL